jgi:hypothetical protein
MGFFSKIFGGGKQQSPVQSTPTGTAGQQQVGTQLADFFQKHLARFTPGAAFQGPLSITDPTATERTGIQQLSQFLSSPNTGPLFQAGAQQLRDTLAGRFADPATSPFIQSQTALNRLNTQDALDATRRSAGSRGAFFSRSAMNAEQQLQNRSLANLQATIGDFQERERGRQFAAAPIAQQFDQFQRFMAPLAKLEAASSGLSGLTRTLEQASLERNYQDFVRQRNELSQLPGQALNFANAGNLSASFARDPQQSAFPQLLGQALGGLGQSGGGGFFNTALKFAPAALSLFCWVAAELYGGWFHPKTIAVRQAITTHASETFKQWYVQHGEALAAWLHDHPWAKLMLRPRFDALVGGA